MAVPKGGLMNNKEATLLMPVATWPALGLWMGMASLVFGIIVMIFPKILNDLVGIYLIIIGVMAIIRVLPSLKMTLVVLGRPLAVVLVRVPVISV
jgi:hypothetical protein